MRTNISQLSNAHKWLLFADFKLKWSLLGKQLNRVDCLAFKCGYSLFSKPKAMSPLNWLEFYNFFSNEKK